MRFQARVVNAVHAVMPIEHIRQQVRTFLVLSNARLQGADSPQRQVTIERCAGDAQAIGPPGKCLQQFVGGGNHRSTHDVTVAVDVLRCRVDDEIGAQRNGLLQGRRQEGVVHRIQRADLFCPRRDLPDIDDPQ